MDDQRGRFGLAGYYLLEGLNSLGTNVFFLGSFFHARQAHGFTDTQNLLLAATEGAAYVAATRAGGRLADRAGTDTALAYGLVGMCAALGLGWGFAAGWALYAAMSLYSAASALTWPALEAAVARAPGGATLARRTGLYNVTWSLVGAVGFFLSGPLFAIDVDMVFWAPLAAHLLQLGALAVRGRRLPGAAEAASDPGGVTGSSVPRRPDPAAQASFRMAAWVSNGLGYFLFGAFSALGPTLGERLGLGPRQAIWLVSSYLFARSGAFVLFWAWTGWEYRRRWLGASLVLPPAAFAGLLVAPGAASAILALSLLGALSGLAYSASLHVSLDRERGLGEGGGLHEWVIGIGVLLGPMAGVAGTRIADSPVAAGMIVATLAAATAAAGLAPLLRRPGSR